MQDLESLLILENDMHGMQNLESLLALEDEMHGMLVIPSPESPLERFLTPNWVEDANNLYARVHMRDLNVRWEGLTVAETRQAIARELIHRTTRNASEIPSSDPAENLEPGQSQDDGPPGR